MAYDPEQLNALLYRDRAFFDYGGHLDIYPMEQLPYWRLHMRRRQTDERQATFAAQHPTLLDAVREAVRQHGPLGTRDLPGSGAITGYRGRKDTALALYHLWLTGELMTHSRRGFERLYDLRERIVPPALDYAATEAEVERFFSANAIAAIGWGDASSWASHVAYRWHRKVDRHEAQRWLGDLVAEGTAARVFVDGRSEPYYVPASDLPLLDILNAGGVPDEWKPVGSTTAEEVTLLSPLDNLLGRKRLRALFGFEHLWEIYKPAERRRWGAYTMPMLYEDRLVGRFDPKLDRERETLLINGLWLEDDATAGDPRFVAALATGLVRLARFLGAQRLDLAALDRTLLRAYLEEETLL